MSDMPVALLITLSGVAGAIVSLIVMPLKGREWVKQTALEAVESQVGRNTILAIAAEKHLRIEDKLDQMCHSIDAVAKRLETRIDTMQSQMTQQISKLDAETRQLEMRLVRIEQHQR